MPINVGLAQARPNETISATDRCSADHLSAHLSHCKYNSILMRINVCYDCLHHYDKKIITIKVTHAHTHVLLLHYSNDTTQQISYEIQHFIFLPRF